MGSRSKVIKSRNRRVSRSLRHNAHDRSRLPKKYRGFHITGAWVMLPFFTVDEWINRIRYQLWLKWGIRA